jgi:hypothetical protein
MGTPLEQISTMLPQGGVRVVTWLDIQSGTHSFFLQSAMVVFYCVTRSLNIPRSLAQ